MIRQQIAYLEQEAFGKNAYPESELRKGFTNPRNIAVVLRQKETNTVVGFLYTLPIDTYEQIRQNEMHDTIMIDNVAIGKECRGKGLVALLHATAEQEMRRRGYKYFEIQAQIHNGYADKIAKIYHNRIVTGPLRTDPAGDAQWGARMIFKIKL